MWFAGVILRRRGQDGSGAGSQVQGLSSFGARWRGTAQVCLMHAVLSLKAWVEGHWRRLPCQVQAIRARTRRGAQIRSLVASVEGSDGLGNLGANLRAPA